MVKYYKKDYYRPQFVRNNSIDLCGEWDFVFDDEKVGEKNKFYKDFPNESLKIVVPFSYETPNSKIFDENHHEVVWYRKEVKFTKKENERIIIHFEGADYYTKLWVNGEFVGLNKGGHHRFSYDITNYLKENENNELVVECIDTMDTTQPRGKQRWLKNSFGCWYVQTTGIWKPVWCEVVNNYYLKNVKMTPSFDNENITFEYNFDEIIDGLEIETEVLFDNVLICKNRNYINRKSLINVMDLRCNEFDFKIKTWEVGNPNLYDVKFKVYLNNELIDEVGSYFGLRKIAVDANQIKLNNHPIYQKLILAQNYWRESGLTVPSEEAIIYDLEMLKKAGFNGLRIHQKIEDERFLYYCDVMGLIVWGEYPATYEFNDQAIENLTDEWVKVVKQFYNHPSIITWVPFNESWGIPDVYSSKEQQNFTEGIYKLTKSIDTTRLVITNDGWEHTISDILTLHDYGSSGAKMKEKYCDRIEDVCNNVIAHGDYKYAFTNNHSYCGQPIIISEYGGLALEGSDGWGYNDKMSSVEKLVEKYKELTLAIKSSKNICGFVYTQLTDTYQETNGLLDFDHKPKLDLNKIKEINDMN